MTPATSEQFAAAYRSGLETWFSVSQTALESVEKLAELNINVVRSQMQELASKGTDVFAVKDPQELLAWNASQVQPSAEKMVAYSRHIYDIATAAQAEFTRIAENQIADSNRKLASIIDSASKNAPAGSETAVSMMKSALAAANSAYDSLNKAAKQAVEMTEANVTAATNAAVRSSGQAANASRVKKTA